MTARPTPTGWRPPVTVTVVVCVWTPERWDDMAAAFASLAAQTVPPVQTLVVVDHDDDLLARLRSTYPDLTVLPSTFAKGLAGARNTGIGAAVGDVVAFLDDDAAAEPEWVERLLAAYDDERVLGVGGRIDAAWPGSGTRPAAFPAEFDWVVGCTYRGHVDRRATVRNMIGANMSVRRDVLRATGGFHTSLGRVGNHPVGCEETELCLRATALHPAGRFVHEPAAGVRHRVPAQRTTWAYFSARCRAEGRSKAAVSRLAGTGPALETERAYVRRVLPAGVRRGLAEAARGDLLGLVRAAWIVGGLVLTAAGYAGGRVSGVSGAPDARPPGRSAGSGSSGGSGTPMRSGQYHQGH